MARPHTSATAFPLFDDLPFDPVQLAPDRECRQPAGFAPDVLADQSIDALPGAPPALRQLVDGVWPIITELLRLRSCLNWAESRRKIPWAPHIWVPRKPDPRDTVMTEDEVLLLIDNCVVPHVRLFTILAITTAGRSTAILELTWDRVDFDLGTIDLNLKEVIDPLTKKARKGRSKVKMTEEARQALLEAKEGARTDSVIEWNDAAVLCIRKGFQGAVARAGLAPTITPHVRATRC